MEAIAKLLLQQVEGEPKKDRDKDKRSKKEKKKVRKEQSEPAQATEPAAELE
ncbi:hypothetical protein [Spirosoma jeollabukense]